MSLAIVHSRGLDGLSAPAVAVEVYISGGLPRVTLVGLPDTEVKEAGDRVRAALLSSGFEFPARRITINLAPAELPKESGRFDLPIALGILAASGQIPVTALDGYEFAGELSLSGTLRPIRGALAMVLAAGPSGRRFVLPEASAQEAVLAQGEPILTASTLLEVCAHLSGQGTLTQCLPQTACRSVAEGYPDLAEVRGQAQAGNLKILGVMSAERDKIFPDVPTFKEQGVDVQFYTWRGLGLPKGVPANVKAKIADAYKKAYDSQEFQEFAAKASLNLAYQNSADFSKFLDQNYKDVEAVMKGLGLAKTK